MTLWPQLSIDPEETLLSYTDRLSMMHTGRGMERLLADLHIHKEHFISGRADAVARLAGSIGVSDEDLDRNAIRVFRRGASFRGESISKTFLSPRTARYCPACLEEDGPTVERRYRILWGFRHVSRCHKHGIRLVDAPVKDAVNLRIGLGMSPLERPCGADGETPEYLEWLRKRVHGAGGGTTSWLEGQTIEQVLAASEMLGAILEHGHAVPVTKLKPMQTEEATDIGFSIYREGPAAIEEALDTIRQTSSATAVQAGSLAYYGNLFDWLDRRCNALDPGPIRDILRDHIVKHSAIEPGTRVLGVEITERRYHTISSLSTEVGIDRPRLSRLLKKLGQVPQGATEIETGNMVFNSVETVSLIEAFRTAIPLSDVPDYLGASKRQVEILYREGFLKPLIPRNGRGSVRHVVFSRKHLDDLLCKIDSFPELGPEVATNLHPISYACQRGAGRFEDVFRKILARDVSCFRHPDRSGVGAVFVDVDKLLRSKMPS